MRHDAAAGLALALLVAAAHAQPLPGQAARVRGARRLARHRRPVRGDQHRRLRQLRQPGPAIEAFAGRSGHDAGDPPVGRDTLFAMGSTSNPSPPPSSCKLRPRPSSRSTTPWARAPQYPPGARSASAPAQHDERHPQLLRDRGDVADLGRGAARDFTAEELVGARLPDRHTTICRSRPATTIPTPTTSSPA